MVSCTGGWKAIPCVKWEHGLEETGKLPVKTKRFSNNLRKEEALLLLSWALPLAPDSVDPEKAFPGICFPIGPRGVWANADGVGGLGVDPFPNCIPQLLEKRNEEGLEFGLNYEKLRKNGISGKEISAKQEKLLFFSSISRRAFNSVSLLMSASLAVPRWGPLTPKESKFTCFCWLAGSLPENPLSPPPTTQASHLLPAPSPTEHRFSLVHGLMAPLGTRSEPGNTIARRVSHLIS